MAANSYWKKAGMLCSIYSTTTKEKKSGRLSSYINTKHSSSRIALRRTSYAHFSTSGEPLNSADKGTLQKFLLTIILVSSLELSCFNVWSTALRSEKCFETSPSPAGYKGEKQFNRQWDSEGIIFSQHFIWTYFDGTWNDYIHRPTLDPVMEYLGRRN